MYVVLACEFVCVGIRECVCAVVKSLCVCVCVCVCVCIWVGGCMPVCVCVCVCVFVSNCQATKVLISKYLATRRVVVLVGGVNGSERQLLTSLIHAP